MNEEISDLITILNGKGISDRDRLLRLKQFLSSRTVNGDEAETIIKIFNKVLLLCYRIY